MDKQYMGEGRYIDYYPNILWMALVQCLEGCSRREGNLDNHLSIQGSHLLSENVYIYIYNDK